MNVRIAGWTLTLAVALAAGTPGSAAAGVDAAADSMLSPAPASSPAGGVETLGGGFS